MFNVKKKSAVLLSCIPLPVRQWLAYLVYGKSWILLNALRQSVERAIQFEIACRRFPLWLPVAALGGVLLFFAANHDPTLFQAFSFLGFSILGALLLRNHGSWFAFALLLAMVATGFMLATLHTHRVAAPKLDRPMWLTMEGMVEHSEKRNRGSRIVMQVQHVERLSKHRWPAQVRVNLPSRYSFKTGDRVQVNAFWFPPFAASRPEGYDFARTAFFNQIGAVGTRVRSAVLLEDALYSRGWQNHINGQIEAVRNVIAERIQSVLPRGDARAITIALVNGQRGEISRKADEDLRLAGLYHVISISGLHMALFAGAVFMAVRLGGVLLPTAAERYPVRNYAAFAASLAAFGYLLISGSDIPAVRSYLMVALVFLAMMLGRTAITQRNLALSAALVILIAPEAVLGPSFQMSFAAVMLLVAWYEPRPRKPVERQARPPVRIFLLSWLWKAFWVAVVTTLLATLATSPFAAYHFQRFAPHALAGNLMASPLVALVVMPAALVGLILMPFQLDAWAWKVMALGVQGMLDISAWVAGWPAADMLVPAFSNVVLLLFAFGLVWVALWASWLRWLGLMPVVLSFIMAMNAQKMDVYIAPNAQSMAMRAPDGALRLIGARGSSFEAQNWLLADADARKPRDASLQHDIWCDAVGCTAPMPSGQRMAFLWSAAGLREDCGMAAVIVTRLVVSQGCREKSFVLDKHDLEGRGAVSGYFDEKGTLHLRFAQPQGTSRLWYSR